MSACKRGGHKYKKTHTEKDKILKKLDKIPYKEKKAELIKSPQK